MTANHPDAHGVPEETIIRMIKEYHEFKKSFLEKYNPDFAITILPHEFESAKKNIGKKILDLMINV